MLLTILRYSCPRKSKIVVWVMLVFLESTKAQEPKNSAHDMES